MLRYLSVVLLVVAIAGASYVGCGPRATVAGKKIMDKIDDMLGDLNVKLADVEAVHEKLKNRTQNLRKKRIRAEVNLKNFTEGKTELESKVAKYKDELGRLRDLMDEAESSGKVEVEGNEISAAKLELVAETTIKKLEDAQRELTKNKTLLEAWTKSLAITKNNFKVSETQLDKLNDQIEEIKVRKSALDTMKEASTIVGNETSISDDFSELTKKVDELITEIDIETISETEKVDERMASNAADLSLDEILGAGSSDGKTRSKIDAILAK